MRATDLRLWFIGLATVVAIGASAINAWWSRVDYDGLARIYATEIAQLNRVSQTTPAPRILFAGGSSVIYAFDPKMIERTLGVPVINMAMSNRIASDANYFDFLLPQLRKGDLVIYSNHVWWVKPSRQVEANDRREARRLADRLWHHARIDLSDRHDVDWPLLMPIPDTSLINRLRASTRGDTILQGRQRDDHGGLVNCPVKKSDFKPFDAPVSSPDGAVIARSRDFVARAKARGAKVIFFETRILVAERDLDRWSRYRQQLRQQLAEIAPMLDATESDLFVTDPGSFCDSASHVDDEVRVAWSKLVSVQLRRLPDVQAMVQKRAAPMPQ